MRSWFLVALIACGGKKEEAPPAETKPSPTVADGTIAVFVNDQQVAVVDAAKIATWPRLDAIVPADSRKIGTWQKVQLVGAKTDSVDGRGSATAGSAPEGQRGLIDKPSENYRDMVPALYPPASFGMFDPVELAKHGKPAVHGDALTQVRVAVQANGRGGNEDNAAADSDPTKLVIAIKTPKGESTLTGDKLLAIPRENEPGGEKKGWRLATLLDAAGVKEWTSVTLADSAGTSLPIERADVSETSIPFIKLNKQGQLRVRVYKQQGDGWTAAGDLRSMTSITVTK